jgi:hypothetical protein
LGLAGSNAQNKAAQKNADNQNAAAQAQMQANRTQALQALQDWYKSNPNPATSMSLNAPTFSHPMTTGGGTLGPNGMPVAGSMPASSLSAPAQAQPQQQGFNPQLMAQLMAALQQKATAQPAAAPAQPAANPQQQQQYSPYSGMEYGQR